MKYKHDLCSIEFYQTMHLSTGFIRDPDGHSYALAKSSEFDKGPQTLVGPGECTEDLTFVSASSGRIEPHQICA